MCRRVLVDVEEAHLLHGIEVVEVTERSNGGMSPPCQFQAGADIPMSGKGVLSIDAILRRRRSVILAPHRPKPHDSTFGSARLWVSFTALE